MFSTKKCLANIYYMILKIKLHAIAFILSLIFTSSFVMASSLESSTQLHQSTHYKIQADFELPLDDLESVSKQLEHNYKIFDSLFSSLSDRESTNNPINVHYFYNKKNFDTALSRKSIHHRKSFIYFYYKNTPKENILYIYPINGKADFSSHLGRHSFFSYIFEIFPAIPTWLREGLALSYTNIHYDNNVASVSHNNRFFDDLKNISKKNPITLIDLMTMTDESATFEKANFERNFLYSWGLVNFLIFSGQSQYLSTIKQAISTLALNNSQAENAQILSDYLLANLPNLEDDFREYLNSQPNQLIEITAMREAYQNANYESAKNHAQKVLQIMPDSFLADYYLGLVAFSENDFSSAKKYYENSLKKNAPPALIDFCMGYLSFYGENDAELAISFFNDAKTKDSKKFGIKSDKMIKTISDSSKLPKNLSN